MKAGQKAKVKFYPVIGGWRWKCESSTGKDIARGTRVTSDLGDLQKEVRKVLRGAGSPTFYQDVRGQWRWRIRDEDGRIVAVSSESYRNATDCRRAMALVIGART